PTSMTTRVEGRGAERAAGGGFELTESPLSRSRTARGSLRWEGLRRVPAARAGLALGLVPRHLSLLLGPVHLLAHVAQRHLRRLLRIVALLLRALAVGVEERVVILVGEGDVDLVGILERQHEGGDVGDRLHLLAEVDLAEAARALHADDVGVVLRRG